MGWTTQPIMTARNMCKSRGHIRCSWQETWQAMDLFIWRLKSKFVHGRANLLHGSVVDCGS
jgi:hypothetical protein